MPKFVSESSCAYDDDDDYDTNIKKKKTMP